SLFYMSLKVPFYAQTKAFYGLSVLLPFCFFGVMGWEFLSAGSRAVKNVLAIALVGWGLNSVASFWINSDSIRTHLSSAISLAITQRGDEARQEFLEVLKLDAQNEQAHLGLAR